MKKSFLKHLLFTVFFLIPILAVAQKQGQPLIDSLLKVLPWIKEDTNKVNILKDISYAYYTTNPDNGLQYGNQALVIAEELKWDKGIANALNAIGVNYAAKSDYPKTLEYNFKALKINEALENKAGIAANLSNLGNVYLRQSDNAKALEYYRRALKINESLGEKAAVAANLSNIGLVYMYQDDYPFALEHFLQSLAMNKMLGNKVSIANNLANIGIIYYAQSDYPQALEYQQQTLSINEQLGRKNGVAKALTSIGNIYYSLSDYPKALEYLHKALEINKELGDKANASKNYNDIGSVYMNISDYPKALEYHMEALKINEPLGQKGGMAESLAGIGNVYGYLSDYPTALEYHQQALKINEQLGKKRGVGYNLIDIGQIYFYVPDSFCEKLGITPSEKFSKAYDYTNRALQIAVEIGAPQQQRVVWKKLSEMYEKQKEFGKSLEAFKNYIRLRDSIDNTDKQNQITRLQMQFDFDKKETAFRFDKQLSEEKLLRQEKELHLKQQALELAQKEKDIQQLAYLKTQAELETEQSKTQEKEKALTIAEQQQQLQTTALKLQQSQLDLKNKELRAKKLERNLYLMAAFMIVSAGSYSFYRFRKRKLIENQQALLKERLRLSRDLHDDIGSTLSSINVYSAVAMGKLKKQQTTEVEEVLQKMGVASRIMAERMSDIVWSIHPENDRLENITDRMKTFASMMFNNYGISCTFETEGAIKTASLSIEQRKNFFLIFKEAIHNIVKYAGCKNVLIRVSFHQGVLNLLIKDDGKGFDTQGIQTENMGGNGIKNMKARAEVLNGVLQISSAINKGTSVEFSMKV